MKFFLLPSFIIFSFFAIAQNLVPNPSFEDTIYCPNIDETSALKNWSSYSASPDYYNVCANAVPNNGFGYQIPANGQAYCGLYIYYDQTDTNYREMLGTQLSYPLISGQKYFVTMKASLANSANCASNNICILFSTKPFIDTNMTFSTWQIKNHSNLRSQNIITDTLSWTTISGVFIADSAYNYIVVGNFYNNYKTNKILYSGTNCFAYYYIDDICVSTDSIACNWPVNITEMERKDVMKIFPTPFNNFTIVTIPDENISVNNSSFTVYDLLGKEVMRESISQKTFIIQRGSLKEGIYLLQLNIQDNIYRKKIIITN